jgi:hypothetical protein
MSFNDACHSEAFQEVVRRAQAWVQQMKKQPRCKSIRTSNLIKMMNSVGNYKKKFDPATVMPFLTYFPETIQQPEKSKSCTKPPAALVRKISDFLSAKYITVSRQSLVDFYADQPSARKQDSEIDCILDEYNGKTAGLVNGLLSKYGSTVKKTVVKTGVPKTLKALAAHIKPMCTHEVKVEAVRIIDVLCSKGLLHKEPGKKGYGFSTSTEEKAPMHIVEISVPEGLMGKVIGKNGRNVNPLRAQIEKGSLAITSGSVILMCKNRALCHLVKGKVEALIAQAQVPYRGNGRQPRVQRSGPSGTQWACACDVESFYENTKEQARRNRRSKACSSHRVLGRARSTKERSGTRKGKGTNGDRRNQREEQIIGGCGERASKMLCFGGPVARKWQPKGRRVGKYLLLAGDRRDMGAIPNRHRV